MAESHNSTTRRDLYSSSSSPSSTSSDSRASIPLPLATPFPAIPIFSVQATCMIFSVFQNMFTTSLACLAVLAPLLSRASPIAIPEDLALLERDVGNLGSFANHFPDCSEDPSNAAGPSQYKDGDGVSVSSSCDNGLTTPAVNRFHCWYLIFFLTIARILSDPLIRTDLFVVNYQAGYSNWQNSGTEKLSLSIGSQQRLTKFLGQVIDCATTSSCSEVNINLNSTCTTDTTTWDNTFGGSIQAQIPLWFNKDASATAGLTYDHSFGGAQDVQMCTSNSDTG